jgi:predicted lipoprotein with Yx(FWY)xxD motif
MFSAKGNQECSYPRSTFLRSLKRNTGTSREDMDMRNVKLFASALILLLAGYAYAADKMPEGVQIRRTEPGAMVLEDSKGMTLYTSDKDADDKSNCNAKCAMAWPPLAAAAGAKSMGDWTVVTRDDGSMQWAYKGKPLYTYAKDATAGDTTGDGVGKNWHRATAPN